MHGDSLKESKKEYHGTLKAYAIGFLASILLTAISFYLVISKSLHNRTLVYALTALALTQAVFQLLFFLHLGQEAKPRWETMVFFFMFFILLLISIGSIIIMQNLNDRMMVME